MFDRPVRGAWSMCILLFIHALAFDISMQMVDVTSGYTDWFVSLCTDSFIFTFIFYHVLLLVCLHISFRAFWRLNVLNIVMCTLPSCMCDPAMRCLFSLSDSAVTFDQACAYMRQFAIAHNHLFRHIVTLSCALTARLGGSVKQTPVSLFCMYVQTLPLSVYMCLSHLGSICWKLF